MFRLGYNTNGLAHHRLLDALRLVEALGYEALAITPDPGHLDPFELTSTALADVRGWADDLGLDLVVETGSRFLLDAERKHFPSLLEPDRVDRARRLDFLKRCVDMAAALGAPVVSIWSGSCHGELDEGAQWDHLCQGVDALVAHARGAEVTIGFEPEPGMFLETLAQYDTLREKLGWARGDEARPFGLTLDVGHCLVNGEDVAASIATYASELVNVHLDDIKGRVHEHRMFGTGDLDLTATLRALAASGFAGVASVELSRDSHRGAAAAAEAMAHLRRALGSAQR